MEQIEQVFFNVPLARLEPIFKRWMKEAQMELQSKQVESTPPSDRLLTIHEAAKFLSLSVPTMYGKTHSHSVPFMKRGKRLYFSKSELLEYIKQGRKLTNDELKDQAYKYIKK